MSTLSVQRPDTGWKIEGVTAHPGAVLREDFLVPMGMSAHALALQLRVAAPRVHAILHEKRAVTPDTAIRLARYFRTSAQFWMNLQSMHDLTLAQQEFGAKVDREIEPLTLSAA